ncbi:MAG: EAL domain-containing protein [Methylobacter sp.]|nr:MAG: EAL domain-containing protein [Methylobacter sp.]
MSRVTASADKPVILIVDDTPVNLGVVVDGLENRGYRLLIAQDGVEGLKRAAFVKPNLILLDVLMPGLDGFEVCRRLKANAETADIPVIFMTALVESEHKITGFKAGGVDYLTKPMQIDEVIARVGTHLNLRAMQRQLQLQNVQLQRQQEELEHKVVQRTAELSASNSLLREEIEERKRVEKTMKFIAQRGWMDGGESFLSALARYLGRLLGVDYVIIDKLAADPSYAETVAIYAKGEALPNMQYRLEDTPCENVIAGGLCCYSANVQQQFPKDSLLADMQVESYIGLPLWDSTGKVIGLIAVMDGKPIHNELAVTSILQLVATGAAAELKRRQSEQAVAESRQFLSRVIDTMADPVFVKDRKHRWILLNQAFCEFVGHPMEFLLGKSDFDLFPDSQASSHWAVDEAVFISGEEQVNEEELTGHDGIIHTIVTKKTCYSDDIGRQFLVGIILDISERKQMETELRQREQEFRVLVENSPDPIFRYDREGRRIYANPAVERLVGRPADELMNRMPSDRSVLSATEGEKLVQAIRQVLETGLTAESEVEFVNSDGQLNYFHNRYAPEFGALGEVVGVISIARDITERKLAENLLYQRERELRTLVENLPTMVVRYDRNFRRTYVNPVYLQITGRAESEIFDNHLSESWRATNISADSYAAILAEVMSNGIKTEVSLEWTDGDGRLVSHAMKIVPEYDVDGHINSVLALGFDLSDRRQQQILEANRQRVFEKMAHGDNLHGILEQVALYVESSRSGRRCGILLLDEDKKHLQIVAAPSFPKTHRATFSPQMLDEETGRCHGWVASALRGERVIVKNMAKHPCQSLCRRFIRESGAVACWSEPILSSSNQLLGVVTLYINQVGEPNDADLALLLQAGHLSSIAIERKRIEQQMYRQASYDQLTGLPNRRLFGNRLREEIAKAERGVYSLAVLFIDLDRFKEVNDTLGHENGDELLVEAASRIRSCVRESDTVARLGGDEFVVILPKVDESVPQDRVAQAIVDIMALPFQLGEHNAYVSASIGIAGYPQDADNAEVLIGCADQAMYVAKDMGCNCFSFFTHGMLEQARQRLELAGDLRVALQAGQLEVYYQPIVDIVSGVADKAEALLRWHHPELGMVPPDRFIPLAEETDLIQEIGAWVFREAAGTAKRWNEMSVRDGIRRISVNMSPRQFTKDSGVQAVIDYLQAADINPSCLVVEITEGLLLDDCSAITEKLELLRAAGIQLSLDDFGTGYSAMAYLKKFNIDYLKIDRSFVRDLETDPGDRAIAEAIVVMAHRLGLKVIAEGVETEGQRALLMAVGCEYVQGYLYAKPMPVEAFLDYVLR